MNKEPDRLFWNFAMGGTVGGFGMWTLIEMGGVAYIILMLVLLSVSYVPLKLLEMKENER